MLRGETETLAPIHTENEPEIAREPGYSRLRRSGRKLADRDGYFSQADNRIAGGRIANGRIAGGGKSGRWMPDCCAARYSLVG